jgi:hypothetical protein
MNDVTRPIAAAERDTIMQALSAGVVPRRGLRHIQVGRVAEVTALIGDIARIAGDGAAIRFIIGEYGAGKTFFLNLVRLIALEKKLVVVQADLGPDRRLHGRDGQARGLYAEAVRNMSTRTKPDGGALASVMERFLTDARRHAEAAGASIDKVIDAKLAPLQDAVGGYDYAVVLKAYLRGSENGDDTLRDAALRWIRGEYSTKTEARAALPVRNIIDDNNLYDSLKLLAAFVKIAGHAGLMVIFDEMVNLYKVQAPQARSANYEELLRIINDVIQGNVRNLGFLFGGTPEFLMDTRRGLYSYPALESRLAENAFAKDGLVDMSGPVIRLQGLTPEDLLILLSNIRHVKAGGDPAKYLVPDEAFEAFMAHCSQRIGEAYFRTPRNTIKAFVDLLAVLDQNPEADWRTLLGAIEVAPDEGAAQDAPAADDGSESAGNGLAHLRL